MGQQSTRQAARRAALDAQAQRRRERAERDKRIEALAVDALTALEERKAAIADCERRAGLALQKLTDVEGLSARDVVTWCGEDLTYREVNRLLRLAIGQIPMGE
ncbi:hypothetical protein OO014_03505 [Intrasporangium calvum]|uniref:ANTAR domain-containing protein n=1 Tax=Intrasporangium calvum TaxID=53358 RepID=A0ABT5GER6_9MICO|nr:hypothetical protein [Intrasporangium calvum]MDC5696310.1 hypothetical protein [Intrasporangium calvum]